MAAKWLTLAGCLVAVAATPSLAAPAPTPELDLDKLANPPKRASRSPQESAAGMGELTRRLGKLWKLNCDIPGVDKTLIDVSFKLGRGGYVIQGPEWSNPDSDPVHRAVYSQARVAVIEGAPYLGLPDAIYGRDLIVTFNAATVCEKYRKAKS